VTGSAAPARLTTWKAALTGLLLFAGADALLFRSDLYGWVAKPESSAGWVVRRCQHDEVLLPSLPLTVALFGDSRAGEASAPELLHELWPDHLVTLRNAWVPGSTPRVWSYLFERLDPGGRRFPVVVLALASYDDYDEIESLGDRVYDLPFLAPLVGVGNLFDLAGTFDKTSARKEAVLATLCKWYAWRRDLQDFASEPWQRYREVRHTFGSYRWGWQYQSHDGDLIGVHVEGDRIAGLPAGTDPAVAKALHEMAVEPPPPTTGAYAAYRRFWLGRIVAHAAGRGTMVVFVRMPTRVLPERTPRPPWQPVLDELAQQPHVRVLDRELFTELERPEFFYDALHLNTRGRERWTRLFTAALLACCGPRLGR